jgi:hypothetical protein
MPTAKIAACLGVSHSIVRRQLLEYGIAQPGSRPQFQDESNDSDDTTYHASDDRDELLDPDIPLPQNLPDDIESRHSARRNRSYLSTMSDEELDTLVTELRVHYRRMGIRMMDGLLRSLGHRLPYERIRQSLIRVDPLHRVFQPIRIRRRGYSVPGPNSLWHHDGQHGK